MKTFAAITAALLALLSFDATAAVVKYRFTANVSDIGEMSYAPYFSRSVGFSTMSGPLISLGDSIVGYFSFDTAASRSAIQPDPNVTQSFVVYEGGTSSFAIGATNVAYESAQDTSESTISVIKGNPDYFSRDAISFTTVANGSSDHAEVLNIAFSNMTGNVLDGTTIPAQLSLTDFETAYMAYTWMGGPNMLQVVAGLTSLTLVPDENVVPEPASWMLLLAGVAAIGGIARRRTTA